AEDAERRGRVPALGVVIEVHAYRDLALGLEAGHVGGDEVAAGRADGIRQREEPGQDRRRRVAADGVVAVVEVERVGGGAVDERRVERGDALAAAEYQARSGAGAEGEHAFRDGRGFFPRAGKRHADEVEDADLRPVDGLRRQVFIAQGVDAFRE